MGSTNFQASVLCYSSAIDKSLQHQVKNVWEHQESSLGALGAKQECYQLYFVAPHPTPPALALVLFNAARP